MWPGVSHFQSILINKWVQKTSEPALVQKNVKVHGPYHVTRTFRVGSVPSPSSVLLAAGWQLQLGNITAPVACGIVHPDAFHDALSLFPQSVLILKPRAVCINPT